MVMDGENKGLFRFEGTDTSGVAWYDGQEHEEFYADPDSVLEIMTNLFSLVEVEEEEELPADDEDLESWPEDWAEEDTEDWSEDFSEDLEDWEDWSEEETEDPDEWQDDEADESVLRAGRSETAVG